MAARPLRRPASSPSEQLAQDPSSRSKLRSTIRALEALGRDLRHGSRCLFRQPLYLIAALACLTLGIGANTAVFSVVHAVLLRPLPYSAPEQLVMVWNSFPDPGLARLPLSGPQVSMLEEEPNLFESIGAVWPSSAFLTDADGETVKAALGVISPHLLSVLGLKLASGSGFSGSGAREVFLSHAVWRNRFGGDPTLIGRPITMNGEPAEVVGIMPESFRLHLSEDSGVPPEFDLYVPLPSDLGSLPPGQRFLRVVGRLRAGLDPARAPAAVSAVGERALATYPQLQRSGDRLSLHSLHEDAARAARPVLFGVQAAGGLFLVLACASVANLFLARAMSRRREMAVRTSLGASPAELSRLVLAEGSILVGLGSLAGILSGHAAGSALWALRPAGLSRADLPGLDGPVLLFALGISAVSAAIFALISVRTSGELESVAGSGGGYRNTGLIGRRSRELLTAASVTMGVVLVVGAFLMIQSLRFLGSESVGFDPENVLTFDLSSFIQGEPLRVVAEVERRVGSLPGVIAVGATSHLPFATWVNWSSSAAPEGTPDEEQSAYWADFRSVTPGFIAAARVRLLAGRMPDERDVQGSQAVAVIDRTMARKAFGRADPVGRVLVTQGGSATVIGVIDDIRDRSPGTPSGGQVFWPFTQRPRGLTFMVRTSLDPGTLADAVRGEIRSIDPGLAVGEIRAMTDYARSATGLTRYLTLVTTIFSALALILATVGVYGVVAFVTLQRLPELGIRSVLGAPRRDLLTSVVQDGLRIGGLGVAVGIAAAIGLSRLLGAVVYGVSPRDPTTLAAVGALFVAVVVVASLGPAVRAARVDPVSTLHAR